MKVANVAAVRRPISDLTRSASGLQRRWSAWRTRDAAPPTRWACDFATAVQTGEPPTRLASSPGWIPHDRGSKSHSFAAMFKEAEQHNPAG